MSRHPRKRPLESRLAAQDRKYAIFWLASYKEMTQALAAARDQPASTLQSYIHSRNDVSDPTGKRATRVLQDRDLRRYRKAVNTIDVTLRELPPVAQTIIDLVFIRGHYTDAGVMDLLHVSQSQYYRLRAYALDRLAERLLAVV